MARYVLALGSSHHFGANYLKRAVETISLNPKFALRSCSKTYKNGAKGTRFNRLFFNCAIGLESHQQPLSLYRELKVIEQKLGRLRSYPFAPRTLDIDVLMSLDFSYHSSSFFMPHKELFNRSFFILPSIEAIHLAGWAVPIGLKNARAKQSGRDLCRCERGVMS